MNTELKTKWIRALRAGQYKQGKHFLRNKLGEFCCLGVLCDIVDPTKWGPTNNDRLGIEYCGNKVYAPASLLPYTLQVKLSSMNDTGKSFSEIADYIELYIDTIAEI